jgi:hypothetical protein
MSREKFTRAGIQEILQSRAGLDLRQAREVTGRIIGALAAALAAGEIRGVTGPGLPGSPGARGTPGEKSEDRGSGDRAALPPCGFPPGAGTENGPPGHARRCPGTTAVLTFLS